MTTLIWVGRADQIPELPARQWIDPGGWLVEDQEVRVLYQRADGRPPVSSQHNITRKIPRSTGQRTHRPTFNRLYFLQLD